MKNELFPLTGERLKLDLFKSMDITPAYLCWLNDLFLMRYSNQRFLSHTFESCLAYQKSFEHSDNLFLAIKTNECDDLIGTMTAYINPHHQTVDLGLMIGNNNFLGKGYGYEAWSLLMDALSNKGFRKITAGAAAINYPMIEIMKKSGMTLEAIRRGQELIDGDEVDICYYAKFTS
jgi:RimJ/RimL family protein N-acetyltransferase